MPTCIDQFRKGPLGADGHESGAFLLGGTMKADSKAVREFFIRKAENSRNDADGADCDVSRADARSADIGE
jgi:hypothetical protein